MKWVHLKEKLREIFSAKIENFSLCNMFIMILLYSFMFELLSKLNINLSTKDQVLEVLEKCNTLLIGGEAAIPVQYLLIFSQLFVLWYSF